MPTSNGMMEMFLNIWNAISDFFKAYLIFIVIILLVVLISSWFILKKANKPGWYCFIPIYNMIVLYQIVDLSAFYILLWVIPVLNFLAIPILVIIMNVRLAASFGKNIMYGIGLAFLPIIFYPLLAFSKNKYIGPNGEIRYEAPQPTSSDYSKPQNYKDKSNIESVSREPVISMGSGQKFHSAPIKPTVEPRMNTVDNENVVPSVTKTFQIDNLEKKNDINTVPVSQKSSFIEGVEETSKDPKTIKCSNCGMELTPNSKICFLCGKSV